MLVKPLSYNSSLETVLLCLKTTTAESFQMVLRTKAARTQNVMINITEDTIYLTLHAISALVALD